MIKKLQEDWEKLSQEAQASSGDPVRQRAIVERMNAVSGALRKLSQGSVTRTTLSQAVRETLERILGESRDALFPDFARKADVDGGLGRLEERLNELDSSLGKRLESIESRIQRALDSHEGQNGGAAQGVSSQILEEMASLRTNFSEEIGHTFQSADARLEALERRMAESSERFTEDRAEGERLTRGLFEDLSRKGGELEGRLAALEDRAGQLHSEVQAVAGTIRDAEARLNGRLEEVLRGLEHRDEAESVRRESGAAE